MPNLTQEEIVKIFQDFIDENGMFYQFKDFVEGQGYELEELGIKEE